MQAKHIQQSNMATEPFAIVPQSLTEAKHIMDSDYRIYTHLLGKYQTILGDGTSWTFSCTSIAKGTGLAESTVRRRITHIAKSKILTIAGTRKNDDRTYNIYSFNKPALDKLIASGTVPETVIIGKYAPLQKSAANNDAPLPLLVAKASADIALVNLDQNAPLQKSAATSDVPLPMTDRSKEGRVQVKKESTCTINNTGKKSGEECDKLWNSFASIDPVTTKSNNRGIGEGLYTPSPNYSGAKELDSVFDRIMNS